MGEPDRIWWSANEIAEAGLPDLPGTKRRVNAMAIRKGWQSAPDHARRRPGRGGGWEYHWHLFPVSAQRELLVRAGDPGEAEAAPRMGREEAWAWYDGLKAGPKKKAREKLGIIQAVEALEAGGLTRSQALHEIAEIKGRGARTIWNWFGEIEGIAPADRLPYLAPRNSVRGPSPCRRECSPAFRDFLFSDYLRLGGPSFASCHRRACRVAKANGWATLPEKTMLRRLHEEVPETVIVLRRKGEEALKRLYPAQVRDKSAMAALEAVNADYHKFDVFVQWPIGRGQVETIRPQMVAFQDIYSGRILSWRLSRTPNKSDVALALGDMIGEFGIPAHVLLDNGREFANKFLTGQAKTRHRFRIKDDDIPGLLKTLGVEIHWATPYSGQSKPIERAFRDLCDDVSKDPRFQGAYTGNSPLAKPEDFGSRAVPLDAFLAVLTAGIEEHNARPGRRSATCNGRSFIETFNESYARVPIRTATEAQRRIWLMGAEGVRANSKDGSVSFMGNIYWEPWMIELAGQKVVARFDPEDLRTGLEIEALSGEYLGHAECHRATGFFDLDEARRHARARAAFRRAEKETAKALGLMQATELGQMLDAVEATPPAPVEAKVVRPVFDKPSKRRQPAGLSAEEQAEHEAMVAEFRAPKSAPKLAPPPELDDALARFRRALDLTERSERGEDLAPEDAEFLGIYRLSDDYEAHMEIYRKFGEAMFG